MSLLDTALEALARWPTPSALPNAVEIPTHCLFGSGSVVRVHLESRYHDSFIVHDAGAAIDEFSSSGGVSPNAVRLLRTLLSPRGFLVTDEGVISSPPLSVDEIAPAIAQIANASVEACDYLLDRWKPVIKRDFKKVLRTLLENEFAHLRKQPIEVGHSSRQHKFDFAIERASGGLLLIDAVIPEASAINSAVIRNLDVRNAHRSDIAQRIIYDDFQTWTPAELNLLELGAKAVPFSRAQEVITRLAA